MIPRAAQTLITIVAICCIAPSIAAVQSYTNCNQSCGGGGGGLAKPLQFPFGFSSSCPIQLNCSTNGTAMIAEFPVETVTSNTLRVQIPPLCGRPIKALDSLFNQNYAPSLRNGILLQNCSSPIVGCLIPSTEVQTNFGLSNCEAKGSNKSSISCYSGQNMSNNQFIDYDNLTSKGCLSLFSAISIASPGNSTAVTLDVQVVELGWWLEGNCSCSEHANCTVVSPPRIGLKGYQCQCLDGFEGDGYSAGLGCWKASARCSYSDHAAGGCARTTRVGTLAGGAAAGASLMILVGLLCCYIRTRSKSKNWKRTTRRLSETTGITIPIYPYSLIEKATNSFSEKQQLGTGAYGTVYAGKLNENDKYVAIKRIKHGGTDSIEQVANEIKLLSSVSHPNLVRLLGCCLDKGEQILIYEFMPNGTLYHHLHTEEGNNNRSFKTFMEWPVRLKIATETAQAIAFLHSEMNPPIYHRDIKSTNILLDWEFKSKVADFGLSRLGLTEVSHISTAPQGTPGYLDPQYHQNFYLSDKSDVYSFGVVLVEIITALKVVDFNRPQNEVNLAALATDRIAKGRFEEIIDPVLDPHRDKRAYWSIHKVAELAFRCLAYESGTRPLMIEVANELEQIGHMTGGSSQENVPDSLPKSSSSSSASSILSEMKLSLKVRKPELVTTIGVKQFSPVSVQDTWSSEQTPPSSFSLLNHVVQ